MSMDKCSAEGKVCTYCGKDALPGTDPAVCQDHLLTKEATADKEPSTLKELEAQD
jgi:hypothetical protein